jgi:SAM-dependent methyltransferase
LASARIAKGGYDPTFFGALFATEDKHFWFRARNRVIAILVRQITADRDRGCRILEVGCGTGNVLRVLEQACAYGTVVGADVFPEGLQYARRRTSCALVRADLLKLPFCAAFDLVGIFDVLEHLPDDNRVLRELYSTLRLGGVLMLTVPSHPSLWSYFDEASHHCRRYGPDELEDKLISAGYSIEYLTQFMSCILPLVWVRRRLMMGIFQDRKATRLRDMALGELRIIPVVNDLLTLLLSQEARLISHRARLPIGTSLLAIAKKNQRF